MLITCTGIGRFTGEVTFTERIDPYPLSRGGSFTLEHSTFIASGREKKPEVKVLLPLDALPAIELLIDAQGNSSFGPGNYGIPGKDYIVHYSNNISAGTATVTVEGIGNFTGELTAEFQILPGGQDVCIIPAGVTELEQEAFSGTNFSEFILPDAPVTIADHCFSNLQKQTVQITIPHAGSSVSKDAFDGIENLTIIAPEALKIKMGGYEKSIENYCKSKGYYYEKLD